MSWNTSSAVRDAINVYAAPNTGNMQRNSQPNQNPLLRMRERLFLVLFERITNAYTTAVPEHCRKSVENSFLTLALIPLAVLIYLHINFIKSPVNCLSHISEDWPRDGILRIQLSLGGPTSNLYNSQKVCSNTKPSTKYLFGSENKLILHQTKDSEMNETAFLWEQKLDHMETSKHSFLKSADEEIVGKVWPDQDYILEYSLEYGFFKLPSSIRQKLKIPMLIITLDPTDEKCFGNQFSQFLLKHVVGYSDVLMSSLKNLVDKEENKGFVRDVITGDQYKFANKRMPWNAYIVAGFTMFAFTLSISMLLRYSHHQIFLFIVQLLNVLEFSSQANFPAAALLTVVFALVGMEAIMSEFFNDSTTAFYIILIVWIADQFDTICCRHRITKHHWLKFFFLYHFAFYAYDYRFNGQYSWLALFTSWMFIQHSMIYFFHHFELTNMPYIEYTDDYTPNESAQDSDVYSVNMSAQPSQFSSSASSSHMQNSENTEQPEINTSSNNGISTHDLNDYFTLPVI